VDPPFPASALITRSKKNTASYSRHALAFRHNFLVGLLATILSPKGEADERLNCQGKRTRARERFARVVQNLASVEDAIAVRQASGSGVEDSSGHR